MTPEILNLQHIMQSDELIIRHLKQQGVEGVLLPSHTGLMEEIKLEKLSSSVVRDIFYREILSLPMWPDDLRQ